LSCDSGVTRTPSVGAELIATPTPAITTIEEQLQKGATRRMTHQDRGRLDSLDNTFEVRHDRGNRETLDR
jgi:hypothetical protein